MVGATGEAKVKQGKACDAVIRALEARTGADRADVRHPERDRIGPPVELRFSLGAQEYAIEHTQIEAFPRQIHMGEEFGQFISPVIEELSGRLPGPAVYYLYFPSNARLGAASGKLQTIRRDFVEWVRDQAQCLHNENPDNPTRDRHPHGIQAQIHGIPFGFPYEVVLRRIAHWSVSQKHHGVLLPARYAPENVENQRVARLRTALERKCPKLQRCKEEGARTTLVLEDGDIALSNHVLIGDALAVLLPERSDLPDEIYLVETSIDTMWTVRLMQCDGVWLAGEGWTEFDSADLIDITAPEAMSGDTIGESVASSHPRPPHGDGSITGDL